MFSKSDDKSKSRAPSLSTGVPRGAAGAASTPSIISADLTVVGNLESAGDLQIDGRIEGDIKSRSVTVGETAHVKGAIVADTVRICGTVNGEVRAASVTLARTAKATGDIIHETLSIESGASREGQVRRMDAPKPAAAAKPTVETAAKSEQPKVSQTTGAAPNGGADSKTPVG